MGKYRERGMKITIYRKNGEAELIKKLKETVNCTD